MDSPKAKKKRGRFSGMLVPTIIMAIIAIVLFFIGYQKGGGEHIEGLKLGGEILIQIIPLLIFAFIVAGMIQVLIPVKIISRWVGRESGFRGILIGSIIGGFTPGGPFVSLPIAATMLHAGAGIGTMVAFMTGWSLLAVSRLPLEVGLLGWKFTAVRLACTFFLPVVAGLLANLLFSQLVLLG